MNPITILITISVAMCLVLSTITVIAHQFSLNRIKSKTVGDGQHGVARFADGMSFVTTDTKGDLAKNYGIIAKENYGYNIAVLDLRNPTRSNGNNLLHLVNKYFDLYKENPKELKYKAKAEKYAKIIAKTIINPGGENFAQNQFFYDSAEGLLTAVILLLAEFLPPEKINGKLVDRRHIVSVFKMVQDLLESAPVVKGQPPKSQFQMLMDKLPSDHKAKWFSGATLNSAEVAMMSVLSTILSRLNAFLDSELEQILCFHTEIDAETFCNNKSAIFLILPEEDSTKYFMVSLFLQQFYRELLQVADEHGGVLPRRVMIYADEIGTNPMKSKLKLFLDWGITFEKAYQSAKNAHRKVYYADKKTLEENIQNAFVPKGKQVNTESSWEGRV